MKAKNYMYYNRNPWGANKDDCVCRAISAALDINYVAVANMLMLIAEHYGCDKICICCYHHLLEDIFGMRPVFCDSETVGEVVENNPGHKLLVRVEGHLTCGMYGTVIDTWDCTREIVDCYWIV